MKRYFVKILLIQAQVASYSHKTATIIDPCAAAMAMTVKENE